MLIMTRIFIGLFLLFGVAEAAFALRCGHRLVSEGDYIEEVRYKCGDPIAIDTYTIYREKRISHPEHARLITGHTRIIKQKHSNLDKHKNVIEIERSEQIEVIVEEWVYNFGPRRLMRRLRFENGILRDIDTLRDGFIPY